MNITRRFFLRGSTAAGAVGATVAAPVIAGSAAPMTAQERYSFHLAEFKKAAKELNPRIGFWHVADLDCAEDRGCALIVTAFQQTGRYKGDGIYEGGAERPLGGYTRYLVRLQSQTFRGERSFDVSTSMDRMVLPESRPNTFIRSKVGELS